MYSLYSLGVRITLKGGDELPLTAIEEKQSNKILNQQKRLPRVTTGSIQVLRITTR